MNNQQVTVWFAPIDSKGNVGRVMSVDVAAGSNVDKVMRAIKPEVLGIIGGEQLWGKCYLAAKVTNPAEGGGDIWDTFNPAQIQINTVTYCKLRSGVVPPQSSDDTPLLFVYPALGSSNNNNNNNNNNAGTPLFPSFDTLFFIFD